MSYVCGKPHASEPDILCNRTRVNHPMHSAYSLRREKYVSWTNEDYEAPPVVKKAHQKREANAAEKAQQQILRTIAAKIRDKS